MSRSMTINEKYYASDIAIVPSLRIGTIGVLRENSQHGKGITSGNVRTLYSRQPFYERLHVS